MDMLKEIIKFNEKMVRKSQKLIDQYAKEGYSEDYPAFAAAIQVNKDCSTAIANAKWTMSLI